MGTHSLQQHANTAWAATLTRLSLGVMYLSHAGLKLFVFTLPGTVQFFTSVGFPGWMAYAVVAAELVGGVLLLIGWRTRWVVLALIPILLGAVAVHWGHGWVFSAPGGGWEFPAYLVVWSCVQALLGEGAFALSNGTRTAPPTLRPT